MAGLRGAQPGRFVLQAAIAVVRSASLEKADWNEIVRLYDDWLVAWPTPVVALNRALAVSKVDGPLVALTLVEELESDPRLTGYHYVPAIKSNLLRSLDRTDEALVESERALDLTRNEAGRAFLDAQVRGRGARPVTSGSSR